MGTEQTEQNSTAQETFEKTFVQACDNLSNATPNDFMEYLELRAKLSVEIKKP